MLVTIETAMEEAESPEELGSLVMKRRKKPKTARATAKMKMKISLRRRRLFALVLISGRERWRDFDAGSDEAIAAFFDNCSSLAKKRFRQFRQRNGSRPPVS